MNISSLKHLIRLCFFLVFAFQQGNCQSSNVSDTLNITEFKWTVVVPENFQPVNQEDWNKELQKGMDLLEDTYDEEIENQSVTLFIYKNGQFNTFEANWQPYDVQVDGDYMETYADVNKVIYKAFEEQLVGTKLDSLTTVQDVSGLQFNRFDVALDFPNGMKLKAISFSRLFDKKELTLNITYIDEKLGEKVMEAFLNSKFD